MEVTIMKARENKIIKFREMEFCILHNAKLFIVALGLMESIMALENWTI